MNSTIKLGGLLIVLAAMIFAWSFVPLYRGDPLEPVFRVPGGFRAHTEEAGRYHLWNHYLTFHEGKQLAFNPKFPADWQVSVRDAEGNRLEFVRDESPLWRIGNHAKASIGYIDAEGASEIQVMVNGERGGDRVLSFSQADLRQDLVTALGSFGIAAVLALVGLLTVIWGLFRRARVPPFATLVESPT